MIYKSTKFREDFEVYNKTAKQYDEVRFAGQAGVWSHHRQMEVLRRLLPDLQGKRVLEIGAGTGRLTHYLAQAGALVLATDISSKMLDVAKRRLSDTRLDHMTEFRLLNILDPRMELDEYDYVVALNVLSRLSDPQAALVNISKSMSSRCRFVFSFNCLLSVLMPFGLLVNARDKSLSRDVTSRWYTPARIESFCDKAGLDIITWGGSHYVPNPRYLSFTLPLWKLFDRWITKRFPRWSPSVLAVAHKTTRKVAG